MKITKSLISALPLVSVFLAPGVTGVAHANVIVNGGFEPPPPTLTFGFFNQTLVPGWSTTASDGAIELWRSGFQNVPAYQGTQFAELNARQVSTLFEDLAGIVPGSTISFSFGHRGRRGTDTMRLEIASGAAPVFSKQYMTGITAWSNYTSQTEPPIVSTDANGNMRFSFVSVQGTTGTVGNFLDGVIVDATVCRILRLKSDDAVPLKNTTSPAKPLLGTGAFTGTAVGSGAITQYDIVLKKNEGIFTGKGLIYHDGDFTPDADTPWQNWPEENFPNQSADPFPAGVILPAVAYGNFELSGLTLTTTSGGGTITFGAGGTYSYAGGTFANHSGTYRTLDCAVAVPEPATLSLVALPLLGWMYARRRRDGKRPPTAL